MLECVANVSEGRDPSRLAMLAESCGSTLLDVHTDAEHNRSVFTLGGSGEAVEADARRLARAVVEHLDLATHRGVHPRIGALDVVPFVPLGDLERATTDLAPATGARDRFADWASQELALPCFLYGPLPDGSSRTLPEVRRRAFTSLAPDRGPAAPNPTAGAVAVGARPILVAYNLWITGAQDATVLEVAETLRGPALRTLGLRLESFHQVSCNLIDPFTLGPGAVYDAVAERLAGTGARIDHAELVGLLPRGVLEAAGEDRFEELGLTWEATIEARLAGLL